VPNRTTVIAMTPATQTPTMARANQSTLRGASGTGRKPITGFTTNGRLTWATVAATADEAICGACEAHSNRSTSVVSSVNGRKNFTEALNQSQYRTLAWFFRHINVSNPIATANRVDCQR
jgi:hypothetical protein